MSFGATLVANQGTGPAPYWSNMSYHSVTAEEMIIDELIVTGDITCDNLTAEENVTCNTLTVLSGYPLGPTGPTGPTGGGGGGPVEHMLQLALTGPFAVGVTGTFTATVSGNSVIMSFGGLTQLQTVCVNDSYLFTTVPFPSDMIPLTNKILPAWVGFEGNSNASAVQIDSTGIFTMYSDVEFDMFGISDNPLIYSTSFSYNTAV